MQIPRPPKPPEPRSAASVALAAWLASTEKRQVDVVRALDVSKQLVSFWVTGRFIPGLELAEALEALTDGAVKVMDWRVPASAHNEEALSRPVRQHLRVARLRQRTRRSTKRAT